VTLVVGDCLYLPRGFPHSAETVDRHSDHLTIGLVAVTWQRVLREAIDAEVAAGRLTASLPVGLLEPGADVVSASPGGDLRDLGAPHTFRHWMAREIWRRQPATRLRPRATPALELDTPLVFTPGPLLWLTAEGQRTVFGLGDRILDMPMEAHDFLSALLDSDDPVTAADVKGLDADSRDVVLRRLLAEGTLAHVD
jgi:hypothetical protein